MNKSTLLAVLVFAALAAAAIVTLREKPERGITRLSFRGLEPEAVTAIEIEGPNPVQLRKQDGVWMVEGKRADEAAVKRLLDAVAAVDTSNLVTRNTTRFAELEVEGDKAVRVKLLAGDATVADFVVGSAASGGSNVRSGDVVYTVAGMYRGAFSHARTGWLDLALFREEPEDVRKVEVKLDGKQPYALVRDGEEWRLEDPSLMPEGYRFDAAAARGLVNALVRARARDILDDDPGSEKTGLTDHADTLAFQVASSSGETGSRSLSLGAERQKDEIYARASTREELVTLPAYLAESLRKTVADLRDLTLMSVGPSEAERLEIVQPDKRLVFELSGGTWQIAESTERPPEDFDLDEGAVRRRLAQLAVARAQAEAPPTSPEAAGLEKPSAHISVTLSGGDVVTLKFGNESKLNDQSVVFARGNADERIYLVRTAERDSLLGGLQTFARREAPGGGLGHLDPEKLQNLPPEVRESLLRQLAEQQQRQRLVDSLQSKPAEKK